MFCLVSSHEPKKPATCDYAEHSVTKTITLNSVYQLILKSCCKFRFNENVYYSNVRHFLMYVMYVNLSLYLIYIQQCKR